MLGTAFIVAALILFVLGAIGVPSGRLNLMAAGLGCYMAALLVARGL